MKTVHTPSPSSDPEKRRKADLFKNGNPEAVEVMRNQSALNERHKVLLRVDSRTHVLVHPQDATPEYANELRKRYQLVRTPARGGKKRL